MKYAHVADTLEQEILSGKYAVGDQMPTERQLCKVLGVANHTLRHALDLLAQKGLISREHGRGTFVTDPRQPTMPAARLRSGLRSILLLGLGPDDPEWHDPGNWEQRLRRYQGIVEAGFQFGVPVRSGNATRHEADVDWLAQAVGECGGLIADNDTGHPLADHAIINLQERGIPVVMINRLEDPVCSEVRVDIRRGARNSLRHLLELGHRRIGFLIGADNVFMRTRIQGYKEALAEHGLAWTPDLVVRGPTAEVGETRAATEALLSRKPRATAIVAANDFRAFAVLQRLQELGRRVPQDVSVIGFDDLENARRETPPLTTMRNPLHESGYEAVRMLRKIYDEPSEDMRLRTLKMELVVRESTAPPPP